LERLHSSKPPCASGSHEEHGVRERKTILRPTIAISLMRFLATPTPPQAFRELTARERENLTLIAQGHNNANIADRQVLSPITVRNNVSNIFGRAQTIVGARAAWLAQDRR
jgi:DNA-binding NarL/FixJ family response regulator